MSFVLSRRVRPVLAALLVTGVLAGCGTADRAGAAAFVGGTRVPVGEVRGWLHETLREEPGLKRRLQQRDEVDDLGRELAAQLVREELTRRAAQEEDLAVSAAQVRELISGAGGAAALTEGTPYQRDQLPRAARSELTLVELGREYYDRLAVSFVMTRADSREDARRKARRMAAGPQQARDLLAADRRSGLPAQRIDGLRASAAPSTAAGTPLFGARAGTVLAYEPRPGSGQWLVARITRRDEHAEPDRRARPAGEQVLSRFGEQLLGLTAAREGVRLSPRYGVWDPIALTTRSSEDELRGFRIEP
ncbi:SurA N-terminal domain-containing protein [Salinifilum ghardaiensis]